MGYHEIIGFICSVLIGVSLGLVGGGGSILTLPTLIYIMGINPFLSSTYALFIVGIVSLAGALHYIRIRQIHYRAAFVFSVPALMMVTITRYYFMNGALLHDIIIGEVHLSKKLAMMLLFAGLIITAALSMISKTEHKNNDLIPGSVHRYGLLALSGGIIGGLTGIVGIGGGFLIVPGLVLLGDLTMSMAIGTSLVIIAMKSLISFMFELKGIEIDWSFLFLFSALGIAGIGLGTYLSGFVEERRLKKYFGWFILLIGISVLFKELYLNSYLNHTILK